jgi:hypothetical protein
MGYMGHVVHNGEDENTLFYQLICNLCSLSYCADHLRWRGG